MSLHGVGHLFLRFYRAFNETRATKMMKTKVIHIQSHPPLCLVVFFVNYSTVLFFPSVKDVSQRVDSLLLSPLKVRRILKGHQGKVLCLNWAQDRRHLVSSSQVCLGLSILIDVTVLVEQDVALMLYS